MLLQRNYLVRLTDFGASEFDYECKGNVFQPIFAQVTNEKISMDLVAKMHHLNQMN